MTVSSSSESQPPSSGTTTQDLTSSLTMSKTQNSTTTTTTAAATSTVPTAETTETKHSCNICGQNFLSRNALFRHLRSDACGNDDDDDQRRPLLPPPSVARKVAIQFGYYTPNSHNESLITNDHQQEKEQKQKEEQEEECSSSRPNEVAGDRVRNAFFQVLRQQKQQKQQPNESKQNTNKELDHECIEEGGSTLASAASLRHPALVQDYDCAATFDVLGINYKSRYQLTTTNIQSILNQINHILSYTPLHHHQQKQQRVFVHDIKVMNISTNFHAERSCTQRSYHYLLPLRWLNGGSDAANWYISSWEGQPTHRKRGMEVVPAALRNWKQALRSAESFDTRNINNRRSNNNNNNNNNNDDESTSQSSKNQNDSKQKKEKEEKKEEDHTETGAPGRYGSLRRKVRRPWHSFANPDLRGMASPSHEVVWRTVDRARATRFIVDEEEDSNNEVYAVAVVRGDSFLEGQVRHIIGSAIAIANGWLPADFFNLTARADVSIETPNAPPGRMYLGGARFHFLELSLARELFDNPKETYVESLTKSLIRRSKLQYRTRKEEDLWLDELRDVVAPRIQKQLDHIRAEDDARQKRALSFSLSQSISSSSSAPAAVDLSQINFSEAPPVYNKTLSILRDIAEKLQWPATSAARSRVIRGSRPDLLSSSSSLLYQRPVPKIKLSSSSAITFGGGKAGSFTIVNPDRVDNESQQQQLPLGNTLFPELVHAVFELEQALSLNDNDDDNDNGLPLAKGVHQQSNTQQKQQKQQKQRRQQRPPSSHCAINRNAEFTPHVDSGKGEGQSLSMIVGLGDFKGGALIVEGDKYNVRYRPLEFDGWKQRHWTESFQGERFSLVWFTPEQRRRKAQNMVQKSMPSSSSSSEKLAMEDDGDEMKKKSLHNDNNNNAKSEDSNSNNNNREEDQRAQLLAQSHSSNILPTYLPMKFRLKSTDALAIYEILDNNNNKGCSYERKCHFGPFQLSGHSIVLDIGAHIGTFTRYILGLGSCKHIIVYEPDPDNIQLLRENTTPRQKKITKKQDNDNDDDVIVEIHEMAIADGSPHMSHLIKARHRNDGTLNTWRHSLEEYSQYVDRSSSTKLPSPLQEHTLTRTVVKTVPLFRSSDDSDSSSPGALRPGITLIKMDCEGAEIDILQSSDASNPKMWLDVTHIVVEWSFTKERRISRFHKAISNLEKAGFQVDYDGRGSWWDEDNDVIMWPYHTDLLIFAIKKKF